MHSISNAFLLLLLSSFLACGTADNSNQKSSSEKSETQNLNTDSIKLEDLKFRLDMLVANHSTAPIAVMIELSKDEKDVFHADYVNDIKNKTNYKDIFSASLNFGIYKTDLIYDLIHHHLDDGINALEAANYLAEQLCNEALYSETDIENYKNAIDDIQKLENLLFEDYEKTEKYLISHDKYEIAVLTMVGGLIESMYFTSMAIEEHGITKSKVDLLLNEKHQLHELIDLLAFFKDNQKDVELMNQLKEIEMAYGNITKEEGLSAETVKKIDISVFDLRDKIVKNKL